MTGLSRAQVTRLIGQYRDRGQVQATVYRRHRFATRFQRDDIALLAAVDEAHETLSGPATQKILQREYYDFKDTRFARRSEERRVGKEERSSSGTSIRKRPTRQ